MTETETEARLRSEIENDCRRVGLLATLSVEDRHGKYRAAITELFDRLKRNGTELMRLTVFGGFQVPDNPTFKRSFFEDWLQTDDFAALRENAKEHLLKGNFDGFLSTLANIRSVSRAIVLGWGGKEDGNG